MKLSSCHLALNKCFTKFSFWLKGPWRCPIIFWTNVAQNWNYSLNKCCTKFSFWFKGWWWCPFQRGRRHNHWFTARTSEAGVRFIKIMFWTKNYVLNKCCNKFNKQISNQCWSLLQQLINVEEDQRVKLHEVCSVNCFYHRSSGALVVIVVSDRWSIPGIIF